MEKVTPKDLNEAMDWVIENMPDVVEQIKEMKSDNTVMFHHNLGRFLRNTWLLWDINNSMLAEWFYKKYGIFHTDDISGIVLTSIYRKLHDQDLKLEEQIQTYIKYWKNNQSDEEKQK